MCEVQPWAGSLTPLGPNIGRAFGYALVIIFEWAVVAFISFGMSRRGVRIADLVRGSWAQPIHILRDIAIAVGFLIVSAGVLSGLDYFVKAAPNQARLKYVPLIAVLATMLGPMANSTEDGASEILVKIIGD